MMRRVSPHPFLVGWVLGGCLIPPHDLPRVDPTVEAGAIDELCNGVDDDGDGLIDERVQTLLYRDVDGDGYGDPITAEVRCPEPGWVADALDCDDADATIHPRGVDLCDGIDRDCDGQVLDPYDTIWYLDADGDGFGATSATAYGCEGPTGYVLGSDDCNDGDPAIHPGAPELCDGLDRDCDGAISPPGGPWYLDADGDGFGNDAVIDTSCTPPSTYVGTPGDCDDADPAISPGQPEICNLIDDNCTPVDDLLPGDQAGCALATCDDVLQTRPAADGLYWIDPAGTGAFQAWCDMTRHGGGWTLVYAYTFTDYANFWYGSNAVTPVPDWSGVTTNVPVSTTPPLSEDDHNAMDFALWAAIGTEFFSLSNINDHVICQPGTGDLTGPTVGSLSCTNVADIATACSGVTPTSLEQYGYGYAINAGSLFTYWDGNTLYNWPTHDPCGTNGTNQQTGVPTPQGAIYLR